MNTGLYKGTKGSVRFKTCDPAEAPIEITWDVKPKKHRRYSQDKIDRKHKAQEAQNRIRDARQANEFKNCLTCFHYAGKHCDGVSDKYCCKHWFEITGKVV